MGTNNLNSLIRVRANNNISLTKYYSINISSLTRDFNRDFEVLIRIYYY